MKMQLLLMCFALCAVVFTSTDARSAHKGHHERGLRTYQDDHGHHKGGHRVLGAGVVPLRPEDIGKGIEPEVTEAPVQFIPYTSGPQPQTEKPYFSWNSAWNDFASGVNDIGDALGDAASNVGDTVGNWGEDVGKSFNEFGERVGNTVDDWGEVVDNTVDDWGNALVGVAEDVKDTVVGAVDDATDTVKEAQIALVDAARIAGEKLKKTYQDAKEGASSLRDQVVDSLKRFGILVGDGAKYVANKLVQITDQVHSSAIIRKLQQKLEQGDEQVAEFLQLIGYKMETWFQSHTQVTQHADIFQDAEIQGELQQLVENGVLTANDVNILVATSDISSKLQQLMERGDDSVTGLIQLLTQKIARWYEENGGSVSQVTQQVPSFFQDSDIQEELKELVEQGILTNIEIKTLTESTSVISKLQEAIERGDERVTQIFVLMEDRRGELESQQDQRDVEILPDIFQDDEVQDDLQNLVDAGTLTQDDFDIITQQQSRKGHINIEKRKYESPEWLNSVGDTFNNWGDVLSETASNVGDTLSDTASHAGETVVDWSYDVADEVVDVAGDIKDSVADTLGKKKRKRHYTAPEWVNSVGDTFNNWGDVLSETASNVGDTLSDTASNVGETVVDWSYDVADEVVDVAGDIKDYVENALQKREYSSELNPAMRRKMRSWVKSLQQQQQ